MNKLFIPPKIKVGFQNRSDTYTGKLSYIIYYDIKGKLRKETSWQSWRDEKIEPQDFDNAPTEGFVLNKKVGGHSSGWDHRNTYCRVYDPRGFEFEITIQNLLFILQETTSHKGKGLEGTFVYAMDGKDLILLPTGCKEIVIVSYHFASRFKEEIRSIPWDMVTIDEAHKLRNAYRPSNRLGQNIRWAVEDRKKVLPTAILISNLSKLRLDCDYGLLVLPYDVPYNDKNSNVIVTSIVSVSEKIANLCE